MTKKKVPNSFLTCVYVRSPSLAIYLDIEDSPAAVTVEIIRNAVFSSDEFLRNSNLAAQVFTLWMISPLLELQLKLNHKPFNVRQCWKPLLQRYCKINIDSKQLQIDEPLIMLQRNLFFSQKLEEKIQDESILELLYEEARYNIIEGRYPCNYEHFIALGALQAHIELGPYNPYEHTIKYFQNRQHRFLPFHMCHKDYWTWIRSKRLVGTRLFERFQALSSSLTRSKSIRKYLEFCWTLPFYGSAYFKGQLESTSNTLKNWLFNSDYLILIAINANGIFIIDEMKCELLLGLKYSELNWDYAEPAMSSRTYDRQNSLPCLFLQFQAFEESTDEGVGPRQVLKFLQIFSKQAKLMDILIANFVHIWKNKKTDLLQQHSLDETEVDGQQLCQQPERVFQQQHVDSLLDKDGELMPHYEQRNRLQRLALTTFNESGQCIGKMGSWNFI